MITDLQAPLAYKAQALWATVRPDDTPALLVTFYNVDKGWWRLFVSPTRFYDFYDKRVGEGARASTDPGVVSSRALVVYGLGVIPSDDLITAFNLCAIAAEGTPIPTPWRFHEDKQEWRRYWDAAETNLAANVTTDGRWRAFRHENDKWEGHDQPNDVEVVKNVVDAVLRRFA